MVKLPLMVPYAAMGLVQLLVIIRKCRNLFENFRREQVSQKENVTLIREVGKFLPIFSIAGNWTGQSGDLLEYERDEE